MAKCMGVVGVAVVLALCASLYLHFPILTPSLTVSGPPSPCGFLCDDEPSKFLINTSGCIIPDFPISEILRARRKPMTDFFCSTKERMTEQEGQYLLLHTNRSTQYNLTEDSIKCAYQLIDTSFKGGSKLGTSIDLEAERTLVLAEGVLVTCYNTTHKNNSIFYQETHTFIQPARVEKKREQFKARFGNRHAHREKLNVLLIGTDAVSRFNLIRSMPNVYHYVTHTLGALDFKGYNKIGENSEPNIYNFMTGYFAEEINKLGCLKEGKYLDDCPIVWKYFAKEGYVTAFGEDIIGYWGIFTHTHKFTLEQPVDYLLTSTYRQSKKHHGVPGFGGFNWNPCIGSKTKMRIMHDHAFDLAKEMRDIPYFGFYWSATLTHDSLGNARIADTELMSLMTRLHDNDLLNNTAVFLISDHGLRFGSFRHTYLGMIEEKLPFLLAVFPPWFKKTYPDAWRNLVINTRRLTSNRDLYQTLRHVAEADYSTSDRSPTPGRGQSLFVEVPYTRICADVGIPERHCACEQYKSANTTDARVVEAARVATKQVNLNLQPYPQCATLQLDKVLNARMVLPTSSMTPKNPIHRVFTFLVEFQTLPGGAMLEAMVKQTHKTFNVVGQVVRTNRYGNQSHCIDDKLLVFRTYCYCKDLLPLPISNASIPLQTTNTKNKTEGILGNTTRGPNDKHSTLV